MRDVLQKVWPTGREAGYVRVVRTHRELKHALQGMRPHLVYVYGHGTGQTGHPGLLLEGTHGPKTLPLTELANLLDSLKPQPAVVFLNVAGFPGGEAAPAQLLGANLPLVIWRRLPGWASDSTARAVAWLHRWLQQGIDPVKALHEVNRGETGNDSVTLLIHSRYRSWKTQRYASTIISEQVPHLALNRDEQKALVDKHLRELARSDNRRVMALVAYAAPGNLLESLPEQLQYYLDLGSVDVAEINWRLLQFPVTRQRKEEMLLRDLEAELQLQLQADSNEPIPHLLRRHAPTVTGTGKHAILWLNWGVFGPHQEQQSPLNPMQLGAWLRFTSEFLGNHCPDDLCIVAYAAIESEEVNHQKLYDALKQCRWQPWCRRPAFRLSVLPPLGKVSEEHLYDFLVDGHSRCDPNIQEEIAQRLITKTAGEFAAIAALMQEAEAGSWYTLLNQLRREQGEAAPMDNETPF